MLLKIMNNDTISYYRHKNFTVQIPAGSVAPDCLGTYLSNFEKSYVKNYLEFTFNKNYAISEYGRQVTFVLVPEGYVAETLTATTICKEGDFFYNAACEVTNKVPEHLADNEKFGYFPNCTLYFRKSANAEKPKSDWKKAPVFNEFVQKLETPQPKKKEETKMKVRNTIIGFYWFGYLKAHVQVPEGFTVVSNARDYTKETYFLSPEHGCFWKTKDNDYSDDCFYLNFYGEGKPKAPKYTKATHNGDTYYFVIPEGYEVIPNHVGTMSERGDIYFNPYAGVFYTIEQAAIAGAYKDSEVVVFRKKAEVKKPEAPKDTYSFKVERIEDIGILRILEENPEKNIFLIQVKGNVKIVVRDSFRAKFETSDMLYLGSSYISLGWGKSPIAQFAQSDWKIATKPYIAELKEQIKKINSYKRSHNVKISVF